MKKTIELIVPCYNEEECIGIFYNRIGEVFAQIREYEYIITYIDDGSKDNTIDEIKKIVAKASGKVRYISFSRNFGKEAAMYAGFLESVGDYVACLDVDLQHPPELLKEMIIAIEEGYDCASAKRVNRAGEPPIRSFFSNLFYKIINHVTAVELVPGSTDYRLMKREVVDAIISMPEYERFTKGIYAWVGFKNKWIEYENVERVAGETTWNFGGLLRYAYSGFVAFATTPLRSVVWLGVLIVLISICYAIYVFIGALNSPIEGRNGFSTLLLVMLFLGGVIISILGMIGEYLARIYMEVKRRPLFFIRESNIDKD